MSTTSIKRPSDQSSKNQNLSNSQTIRRTQANIMLNDREAAPHHLHITIASNVSSKPFKFQFN
jgi:hypothetical protein